MYEHHNLGLIYSENANASYESEYMKDHIRERQRKMCRHACTLQLYTQLKLQCEIINPGLSFCPPRLVPYIGWGKGRDGEFTQKELAIIQSSSHHLDFTLDQYLITAM